MATALYNKGGVIRELGRLGDAICVYESVADRFGDSAEVEPAIREWVARAIAAKGDILAVCAGGSAEAIRCYEEVSTRFGDAARADPRLFQVVAAAVVSEGAILTSVDRPGEAVALYDDFFDRFSYVVELGLASSGGKWAGLVQRQLVAMLAVNRGVALGHVGRSVEGIGLLDHVVGALGDAVEPTLQLQVAKALVNKGAILGQLGNLDGVVETCDEVIGRWGQVADPALHEAVVMAKDNKRAALHQLGPGTRLLPGRRGRRGKPDH